MAAKSMRDPVVRLRDIVMSAKELGFQIVVKSPFVEPNEFRRVAPPLKPGMEGHLTFYVGEKVWKDFLWINERYPEVLAAVQELGDVFWKPTVKEPDNGAPKRKRKG
jgi:hypothetical protein